MANSAKVIDHLFTIVLELDKEDIQSIQNFFLRIYKNLAHFEYKDIDRLHDRNNISPCTWRELTDWKTYAEATSPSYTLIMTMMCNIWETVDRNMLCVNHTIAKTVTTTTKLSVTASTVTPSQIEATYFLKHISVSLVNKNQIKNSTIT